MKAHRGGGWVVWALDLFFGLRMKVMLTKELFAICKNWLALEGAISYQERDPRCQSIKNMENQNR